MIWLLSLLWAQSKEEGVVQFNERWRVVHVDPKEAGIHLLGREKHKV